MSPASLRVARLLAVPALLLSASCGTARFYSQAVRGQLRLLGAARPVAEVRADPRTPDLLRRRLDLIAELREFAGTELRLPVSRKFRTFADLGRPWVVLNVYAAPEFSLEAKTWWYPFVGRAKYRGFFEEKLARREAAALERDGYDVYLGGVRVYSTLGWMADPVLNTFIGDEPPALAETIFHELTHSRVFIGGDSDFNEAFATAGAQEGVRRWLGATGRTAALRGYERGLARDRRILELLNRARAELARLYDGAAGLDPLELRRRKAAVFDGARLAYEGMKSRGEIDEVRDSWFSSQFNNGRLVSIATYHDLVPGFARLLRDHGGDLERFYEAVGAMRALGKEERRARLRGGPGGAAQGAGE